MKNGDYRMVFSADGYSSDGRLRLAGGYIEGADGNYTISGRVAEAGRQLIGTFDVQLAPGMSPTRKIGEAFEIHMNGREDDDGFTLIGAGPLGIIVEITCRYEVPADGPGG